MSKKEVIGDIVTVVVIGIFIMVGSYWYYSTHPYIPRKVITVEKWAIDRGWRPNWICDTKEEARELAGNGRIYKINVTVVRN